MKTKDKKKALPPVVNSPPPPLSPTSLADLFIRDHFSLGGNIYDVPPFDTYLLAGTNGEVEHGTQFRVNAPTFQFEDKQHLERALMRMILTIAKHSNRYVTVLADDVHRFLQGDITFAGIEAKELCVDTMSSLKNSFDAPGIPANVAISVLNYEGFWDIGRLIDRGGHQFGAVFWGPHILSAVRVVPTPWKAINHQPIRLPPL